MAAWVNSVCVLQICFLLLKPFPPTALYDLCTKKIKAVTKWSRQWWICAEVPNMPQCIQKNPALSAWINREEDWTDDRMVLTRVMKNPAEKSEKAVLLKVDSSLWNNLGCQEKGEEGMGSVTGMVVTCQLRLVKKSWSFSAVWIASWRHGCTRSSEQAICMCAWELLD